jgi:DNA-binding response OmpR family regulator
LKVKILIVEDEVHLADGLRFNLEAEGYEAVVASTAEAGLDEISKQDFDAIVLDIMLPGIDGFEFTRRLRQHEDFTPILMLTARGRPEDVLQGFEAGTDDYLPKPFELEIFLARLNGLLRRRKWFERQSKANPANDRVSVNGRIIDFPNLEMHDGAGGAIRLTLMEAKLLRYLIDNEGRAVPRNEILENVWELQEDTDTRAIDNFIVRLRKHLEDNPNEPRIVQTVRGIGYKFVRPED